MKLSRLVRFLLVAFVLGGFFGLVSGLAFGGPEESGPASTVRVTQGTSTHASAPAANAATTTSAGPLTEQRARAMGANEMGYIPILSYHRIGSPEGEYTRTPENLRQDLALLAEEGFYPLNVRDLVAGNVDIPAGKSPVVLTFDDSSPDQYRILDNGSLDPDCAVAILQEAVETGRWAPRASFFCDFDVPPFGQGDRVREKLRNLVDWGYEVGSHTLSHLNMKKASLEETARELAEAQKRLQDLIGNGYAVVSLAVPYAAYPADDSILASGEYQGLRYSYSAALSLGGTPAYSPFSTKFRLLHLPRIMVTADALERVLAQLKPGSPLRYVSDGDPLTVSAPQDLPPELGDLLPDLGRPVIRY